MALFCKTKADIFFSQNESESTAMFLVQLEFNLFSLCYKKIYLITLKYLLNCVC